MTAHEGYDRTKFVAFRHYFIPQDENAVDNCCQQILRATPPAFLNLAKAFNKNFAAVVSTACMPFRIASANYGHRRFLQILSAERIRTLKSEYEGKRLEERDAIAGKIASERFSEEMSSEEGRFNGGLAILADLEDLLSEAEMKLAAAELLRQAEVLAWGTLEVLANDLLIDLLNKKPHITETLLKDERTKKRFQVKDISSMLPTYGYNLSGHMGDVLTAVTKIDDVETLRAVFEVLMPNNIRLLKPARDSELWKLNQRRNLILHRRSIVDDAYLRNTGDALALGEELLVAPQQFEKDLALVWEIGSATLEGLNSFL